MPAVDPRREYAAVLVAMGTGGVLVLLALQPRWLVAGLPPSAGARILLPLSGADLVPGVYGLGLLALAGTVGIAATRGWLRRVVGGLVAAAGGLCVASALAVLQDPRGRAAAHLPGTVGTDLAAQARVASVTWGWCWLVVAGGLLVLGAGAVTTIHGSRWPAMTARFERPAGARAGPAADPWTALDRGEDPTLGPGDSGGDGHLPQ